MKHILLLILFSVISICTYAQPQGINYQGVARDASGQALLNQNIALRLSILDSSATGTSVYVETQPSTTNNSGLFNFSIGTGSVVLGVFANISWGQGDKWLKIEMDTAGGTNYQLIGTTQFMSVPFALYSGNGNKPGISLGDMQYWNGTSWITLSVGTYGQTLVVCNGVPTWGGCLPIVTTISASAITGSFARSGGNINSDGGAWVTERGVCWSTTTNPTTANNKTTDGSGPGTYSSNITGLIPVTTYYLRAYAINSQGTVYGNEVVFTTDSDPVVSICTQIWMLKNLNVDSYRNGDPIPKVTDPSVWAALTTGAYCYYNNDSATYASVYGKLYNWYAVNDARGLAPTGYHVPSNAEWTTLENCLGGSSVAGGRMKETGTAHWLSPNTGATNSSGFTGLPGGYRWDDGIFDYVANYGYWWSSSEANPAGSYSYHLYYNYGVIQNFYLNKQIGFSVRCLRD